MLDDETIVQLLTHCESQLGRELAQIRGNLRKEQWLGAIWELIVLDAALALGSVKYEENAPGVGRPDFLFESQGARLWIEAAFLRKEKGRRLTNIDEHPVFRVLKEKGSKAKRSEVSDPYLVLLGTDRVFDIYSSRHTDGIGVEQAVSKAFRSQRSLSAVVLVSIFARPEIFKPLQKRPRPWLYGNPEARVPLTDQSIKVINLFDFERWPFDRFMRPDSKRLELRELLSCEPSFEFGASNSPSSPRGPRRATQLPYPRWTYVWRFNRLCIARVGTEYWLFNNEEFINATGASPEGVAQIASELFQIFPAHVMGPNGPKRNPDPGVRQI
jgi:hypothetical protein